MNNKDVSIGDWILTLILTSIPIVNIVMLCIWAFGGDNTPVSKKNWAKATLITAAVSIGIVFIMFLFTGSLFIRLI